jgi:anti-sigma regulatory factor (Ser/Thr protein kinase)
MRMRRDFPVSSAGIRAAFDFIGESVARLGRDAAVAHRLSIIVDEVCANMIRHDGSLTEGDRFSLEVAEESAATVLVISDPGRPFDPLKHRAEPAAGTGGHGLALIRGLSSRACYERIGARNRLTVSIAPDP